MRDILFKASEVIEDFGGNIEKLPSGVYFIRIGNKAEQFVKM
ncbi:MAG: hypothetical protein WCZ17_02375 [Candidatus Kapaibacterium sp.]